MLSDLAYDWKRGVGLVLIQTSPLAYYATTPYATELK